ncbi:hypothetical protein [Dysgonomonas sp. 511]|uniref:hypothetical protein n=1 Tax=Dysgonomonas sp. 511 TaxID=2302930 RepID=UPI0013D342CF|nr:hypothetical protein [Dysgonomonas sp. 511]NDV77850.1 hypothetical protein [Dysgonomonas sp. 511]
MKYINYILALPTLISLYIIFTIELDIQILKFGALENADKINKILINISYSYFAGLVFYLLVTYIPYYEKRKKAEYAIAYFIDMIYHKSFAPFSYLNNGCETPNINYKMLDVETLKNILSNKTLSSHVNNDPKLKTIHSALLVNRKETKEIIIDLFAYMEFLTGDQIQLLSKLANSNYYILLNAPYLPDVGEDICNRDLSTWVEFYNSLIDFNSLVHKLYDSIDNSIYKELNLGEYSTQKTVFHFDINIKTSDD